MTGRYRARPRLRPSPWRLPLGLSQGGFSLLELLIVMVISAVALMLASRLLLEAQSRLVHEGQRQVEPIGQLAVEQVQADLRMATGVESSLLPGWSSLDLVLRGHVAGDVSYTRQGQELWRRVRRSRKDGTEEVGERLVLDRLTVFRWRQLADGSVDLELGFRRTGRLRGLTASGAWTDAVVDDELRRLRVLPRGAGGARW